MFFGGGCVDDATSTAQVICLFFNLLVVAVFIRVLLSWFNLDPSNPMVQALHAITEPILDPIRRILPRIGMFDISPIVTLILLRVVSIALQQMVIDGGF
ncbi:MAG: YggT family protein [Dehalococcoidia bacterium]